MMIEGGDRGRRGEGGENEGSSITSRDIYKRDTKLAY
jgi:hypothetical protein